MRLPPDSGLLLLLLSQMSGALFWTQDAADARKQVTERGGRSPGPKQESVDHTASGNAGTATAAERQGEICLPLFAASIAAFHDSALKQCLSWRGPVVEAK